MAFIVSKELIATQAQPSQPLHAVYSQKNIAGSCAIQQSQSLVGPQTYTTLNLVAYLNAKPVTGEIHTEYPTAPIGSKLEALVVANGAVTACTSWVKTTATVWWNLSSATGV